MKTNQLNIPIYRAKKIDSDEYIEGYLQKLNNKYCFIEECAYGFVRKYIDPSTLAIHFSSMIDIEGNKIFASLSEDGRGGSILESRWCTVDTQLTVKTEAVKYSNKGLCFVQDGYNIARYEYTKVIGIKE